MYKDNYKPKILCQINLEEVKQAAIEFYDKQHKLMKLLMSLSPDETIEFDPWFVKISREKLELK